MLESVKCAAADEQDVRRIDLDKLLLRVLSSALRWYRSDGSLEDLQQRLLNALTGDITGDGDILRLLRDLIDLIDIDDTDLCTLDIIVCRLNQLQEDVLDILADIAGFGERRRICDRERNAEDAGQGLCQVGLTGTGRSDHQDVRLLNVDILDFRSDALVVVIDRYGQNLLRLILPDDILIKEIMDLLRLQKMDVRAVAVLSEIAVLLVQDLLAELDTLVTDIIII